MFTEIFVQYLQEKGITPYKIAKETGISQGLMNEYKKGIKKPTTENLIKIADFLNCSIDHLLGRTGADENEIKLINGYRSVTEKGKEEILKYVNYITSQEEYKKYTDLPDEA